jgi:hypothetical protein
LTSCVLVWRFSIIDLAWATSGGQLVWAELTDADSDAMNTTLVTVANSFFIEFRPFRLG